MNQNDYYIAFDENGAPYIEHGLLDQANNLASNTQNAVKNLKEKQHKYIKKIVENGKTRYFYTLEELEAYRKQAMKSASDVGQNAENTLNQAKQNITSTAQSMQNNVSNTKAKIQKQIQKAQNTIHNQVRSAQNVVQTRTDAVKDKLDSMQEKRQTEKEKTAAEKKEKATADYYQERRKNGFQDTRSLIGSYNRVNSEYNDNSLNTKIAEALKKDGVELIGGDNPEIRSAQNKIVSSRKSYEQHSIDYQFAKNYSNEAAGRVKRAQEAYNFIIDDGTSSLEAKKEAKRILKEAEADKKKSDKEIKQLEKLLDDDQKAYHSAIQIYNMQLYLYNLK